MRLKILLYFSMLLFLSFSFTVRACCDCDDDYDCDGCESCDGCWCDDDDWWCQYWYDECHYCSYAECDSWCEPWERCCWGSCQECCDDDDCGTQCCMNNNKCGSLCGLDCCSDSQYCCGPQIYPGSVCCDNDEVCCYDSETMLFSCNPPCEVTVVNSTACAESQEEFYECPGCIVFPSGDGCLNHTYRDYTGLQIKGCEYGCSHDMGYEPCFEERRCVDESMDPNAVCMICANDKLGCVPLEVPLIGCIDCDTGGEVLDVYPRYTCINCSDD